MANEAPPSKGDRKHHLLSRHAPAATKSITDAVVLSDSGLFLLTEPDGTVPITGTHGLGLYWKDMRWLDGYAITLDGARPDTLFADAGAGSRCVLQLSSAGGAGSVGRREVGIRWTRVLSVDGLTLHDELEVHNFGMGRAEMELRLVFAAGLADVFLVRGLLDAPSRPAPEVGWAGDVLRLRRVGIDGVARAVKVAFDRTPLHGDDASAAFRVALDPDEDWRLAVTVTLHEEEQPRPASPGVHAVVAGHRSRADAWARSHTELRSDSEILDRIVRRAVADLGMLRMRVDGGEFFAAGLPWFGTLFGRDSLVSAMQSIAWNPRVGAETLRLLTRFQGTRVDAWRDEEPGKILHELRRGELADAGEIPHTPWYGSVDSTPLFLCLVDRTMLWTGDRELFEELRPAIDAALGWIDEAIANGFVRYDSSSNTSLVNQGWKDSGDAIVNADGSIAEPPIALVEVQGYVHRAWRRMAALFRRFGEDSRADALVARADDLRRRIHAAFRLGEGEWALALQKGDRPCAVASSNPGHLLWCDVLDRHEAEALARRLLAPDLFSGWGVRTLTTRTPRFNPVGYHLGTVWPHDNSIVASGLRRCGLDDDAARLCDALLDAASWFPDHRMPELFCGFPRSDYGEPVPYPVACRPQAWGAGAMLGILHTMLGLVPDAIAGRLRVVRPRLPRLVRELRLAGLRVGHSTVDLAFLRRGARVEVTVARREGLVDVTVEGE
jgi:glycogen debranching enzyme